MKYSFFSVVLLMLVALIPGPLIHAQSLEVHTDVDRSPKFKGKPSKPQKFFEKYMAYPEDARLNIIEGVVEVSFVVSDEGKLMEPSVSKSVDPQIDREALRLVNLMQEWKPAKKNGEPVNARLSLFVPFHLSSEEKEFMKTLHDHGLNDKMPLFVIDDKIVRKYIEVPQYNVKSVRVMKGQKAIERYGPDAKNGVVIMTTKRGTPPVR